MRTPSRSINRMSRAEETITRSTLQNGVVRVVDPLLSEETQERSCSVDALDLLDPFDGAESLDKGGEGTEVVDIDREVA